MIVVIGVIGTPKPWKRLIYIENWDEAYEIMGLIRANMVKQTADAISSGEIASLDYLRTFKVKTKDTGLKEYPRTDEEIHKILENTALT